MDNVSPDDAPPTESKRFQKARYLPILSLLVLVAHLPFVIQHFRDLWSFRPHYEFFPFVIAIALGVIWLRWPRGAVRRSTKSQIATWSMLTSGLILSPLAILFFSPWLATVSFLLILGGLIVCFAGVGARRLIAPWLLLWVVIPPPLMLDISFVRWIQYFSAKMASGVFEWGGLQHLLTGYVIELPRQEVSVAEMCSGIHSPLIFIAAGLVIAVLRRCSFAASILLAASGIFWALAAHVTRIVIVAVAITRYESDLTIGAASIGLSIALFAGGVVMLLCSSQLLAGLFAPIVQPESLFDESAESENEHKLSFYSRVWNRCLAWRPKPLGRPRKAVLEEPNVKPLQRPIFPYAAIASFAVLLGALQIAVLAGQRGHEIEHVKLSKTVSENWLPESVGAWRRNDYQTNLHERSIGEGKSSNTWQYSTGIWNSRVSVDYPFVGWHELTDSYSRRGWTIDSRNQKNVSEQINELQAPETYVEAELTGPAGESGFLLFSILDASGRNYESHDIDWTELVTNNPLLAKMSGNTTITPTKTTLQIQLFASSICDLPVRDKEQMRLLFSIFRNKIQEQWQATLDLEKDKVDRD